MNFWLQLLILFKNMNLSLRYHEYIFVSSSGECLSGALWWEDLVHLAEEVGFCKPRLVTASTISVGNAELEKLLGKEPELSFLALVVYLLSFLWNYYHSLIRSTHSKVHCDCYQPHHVPCPFQIKVTTSLSRRRTVSSSCRSVLRRSVSSCMTEALQGSRINSSLMLSILLRWKNPKHV